MKRRFLSLLLSVVLCFSLVSAAYAFGIEFDDNGNGIITDGSTTQDPDPGPGPGPGPGPDTPDTPETPDPGPTIPPDFSGNGGGSGTTPTVPSYTVGVPSGVANGTVSVSPKSAKKGDTVTVTVEPDEGYELERLLVTDAKGNEIETTDKGGGKYAFTMPGSKVSVEAVFSAIADEPVQPSQPTQAMPFTDVKAGDWFYDAVQYVYDKGIMKGDGGETDFNPNGKMNRAMVWTVLARLSGADVDGSGGAWYAKAQAWAMAEGVSDGSDPLGSITREQLVTMLWRYLGSPAAEADLGVFTDSADVSAWALDAVRWAVSAGLLQGEGGRLNPGSDATRAQVAAILMRYFESVAE